MSSPMLCNFARHSSYTWNSTFLPVLRQCPCGPVLWTRPWSTATITEQLGRRQFECNSSIISRRGVVSIFVARGMLCGQHFSDVDVLSAFRRIKYISALRQGFRRTCSGVWGSVSSLFLMGNDFLLQYVDASLWILLDQRLAFRLHVGQLVIQEVACRYRKEILVAVASLIVHYCAIKKNVIVASQLYDVADVHSRVDWVENRFSLSLVESRLSHRLEMLFSSTFVGIK